MVRSRVVGSRYGGTRPSGHLGRFHADADRGRAVASGPHQRETCSHPERPGEVRTRQRILHPGPNIANTLHLSPDCDKGSINLRYRCTVTSVWATVRQWCLGLGCAALLVIASLPWVYSGERDRNSFALVRSADRLDLTDGLVHRAAQLGWLLMPAMVGIVVIAVALHRRSLAQCGRFRQP